MLWMVVIISKSYNLYKDVFILNKYILILEEKVSQVYFYTPHIHTLWNKYILE